MSAVYVVREGKVRGEGDYWDFGFFAHGTAKGDALRLTRADAKKVASKYRGRVVRVVTLSEQLRRAKKRIAELETRLTTEGYASFATSQYEKGRADERAAVVAWLRTVTPSTPNVHRALGIAADGIECGEHVNGGG